MFSPDEIQKNRNQFFNFILKYGGNMNGINQEVIASDLVNDFKLTHPDGEKIATFLEKENKANPFLVRCGCNCALRELYRLNRLKQSIGR